jgi:hypothetical protein
MKKNITPGANLRSRWLSTLSPGRQVGLLILGLSFLTNCAQQGGQSTSTATSTATGTGTQTTTTTGTGSGTSTSTNVSGSCSNGPTSVSVQIFPENPKTANAALTFSQTPSINDTLVASLENLVGNCTLETDRFKLSSDTLYPSYLARPSSNTQSYPPSAPEFQQYNSMYHANSLRNLLVGLGTNFGSASKLQVDAHCDVERNAYFSPSQSKVCLGYVNAASKKVWAADDADVVIHEVGHYVNHFLSSTNIMNSSQESGAIDESVADYWALTLMNDAQLSEWFLGAIGSTYVRDASQNISYPLGLTAEIHDDSRVLTQVLWDLRQNSNLGKVTTDALVKRAMQLLPATSRLGDFYQAFYDASGPAFMNLNSTQRSLIITKFTNKGMHRADSAAGLRLSTAGGGNRQVYVIDDHTYSFQINGNCNGALDLNETALVLVNLENPNGSPMGTGIATLGAAPSGITVLSGGNYGEFFRLRGNSDFINSLPSSTASREDAVLWASFVVKANSTGNKNFSLTFEPMYSDPTGVLPQGGSAAVNFAVNVGSVATTTNCTNASLWP